MTQPRTAMTAGQASVAGIVFMVFGAWLLFVGTGVPHIAPAKGVPLGMVSLFGAMFACAGGATFVRYRYLGALPSDANSGMTGSTVARSIQLGLSLAAVGCMCAMCAWVAFGPGQRTFKSSSSIPFLGLTDERTGRIGFGLAAALLAVAWVARAAGGLRALRR
jgi:hypothetical protein